MLLVTGGGGFVMSHLVSRWLQDDATHRVLVIDQSPMSGPVEQFLGDAVGRVEWRQGDVRRARETLDSGLLNQVEYVVHGAAVTSINRLVHANGRGEPGLEGARDSISTNIDGSVGMLGLASKLPALKRLVNVSSGSVYASESPQGVALAEDDCVSPEDIYAITKFTGELFTRFARAELELPAVSVRLSGVFGPMDRQTPSRNVVCVPNSIAHAAVTGKTLRIRSIDAVGDYIHADDVADAIIALLKTETVNFNVYNIAAGETISVTALLDYARELHPALDYVETEVPPLDIDYDPRRRTGRWGAYDLRRVQADTSWRPRPLKESFQSYLRAVGELRK